LENPLSEIRIKKTKGNQMKNAQLISWLNAHGFTTGGYTDHVIEVMTTKETAAKDEKHLRMALVTLGIKLPDEDRKVREPYTQISIRTRDEAHVIMLGNVTDESSPHLKVHHEQT
jgi:hypothetical protein